MLKNQCAKPLLPFSVVRANDHCKIISSFFLFFFFQTKQIINQMKKKINYVKRYDHNWGNKLVISCHEVKITGI